MWKSILLFCITLLVAFVDGGPLNHIILTFTGDLSQMQVSFRTTTLPPAAAIRYGIAGSTMKTVNITKSQITQFKNATSKSAPNSFLAVVTLTALTRGSTYTYSITTDIKASTVVWTTNTFRTLTSTMNPLRIALFGDMGASSSALNASLKGSLPYYVSKNAIDMVVHFGDLAYNLDSYSGRQGYAFFSALTPVTSRVPYIAGAGNHEYHNNAQIYYQKLLAGQSALGQKSKSTDPLLYFSADFGSTHIVMINTEYVCTSENTDVNNIVKQYNWLKADLAKAAAANQWIIVTGHRNIYTGYTFNYAAQMLRAGIQCTSSAWSSCKIKPCTDPTSSSCGYGFEKLLIQYKVDILFQGHIHYYKRLFPMGDGYWEPHPNPSAYLNPQLPISIVSGAAGTAHPSVFPSAKRSAVANNSSNEMSDNVETASAAAAAAAPTYVVQKQIDDTDSWSLLTIVDSTHLNVQHIDTHTGNILDSFSVTHSGTNVVKKKAYKTNDADEAVCNQ